MSTLLVRHIQNLITLNADRQQTRGERSRTIADGAIFVRDNLIEYVGPTADLPPDRSTADRVIDAREMIILPGMVNTHHHLYQTLTRCIAVDSGCSTGSRRCIPSGRAWTAKRCTPAL